MRLMNICLFALLLAMPLVAVGQSENFAVVKVAEGVYATIRKDSPGLAAEANDVFIINDDDVIVVDTNISPSSTQEVLATLRKLTNKPVKYVINTHWHDDHILGNQVYRAAFPGVEFIAHKNTREYLPTTGLTKRKEALAGTAQAIQALRTLIKDNKSILSGRPLTEEERAVYLNDIKIGERFITETPSTQVVLPTLTIEEGLTLYRGSRTIEIKYLGRGHTSGDLVVNLPQEGIVITGDLVVWPVPYVGSEQSHIGDWRVTLERILALHPAVIIPGHGPILRDDSYVKLMIDLFASIKQQAEAAVARGETLEQARKSVNLSEFRKQFAGDSQFKLILFLSYVRDPAVEAAYNEAVKKK